MMFWSVSLIVKINCTRTNIWLSRFSTFQNCIEIAGRLIFILVERWRSISFRNFLIRDFLCFILFIKHICISCKTTVKFLIFTNSSFHIFSLLYMFGKSHFQLLYVLSIKSWWIWNSCNILTVLILFTFTFFILNCRILFCISRWCLILVYRRSL